MKLLGVPNSPWSIRLIEGSIPEKYLNHNYPLIFFDDSINLAAI